MLQYATEIDFLLNIHNYEITFDSVSINNH